MGEKTRETLKLQFDKRLRLEFHGARITSDAGLLACRELDGVLGLMEMAPIYLQETRGGRNMQHELVPLLRQSVYSRLAGYEDTNDAVRLARDPAMQAVVGRRAMEKQAASSNTLSRFETEVLVTEENLKGLNHLNAEWVDRAMARTPHQRVILDMDSSESPVYGSHVEDYRRAPKERLTTKCHGYTASDKTMKVRMLHGKLKWEIPVQ